MNLVVHKMMQFEHIDHAHGYFLIEWFTRATVIECRLSL
ncbi:MAG: hypothetical protein A4E72_01847 [Syntrophus sp. PtaU1.Bin208]|nr:MAG: hypothetical protein A4E72_01847 [Syntrophus sp. PtaU1.Bin208]